MLYRDRWLACDHRERVVGGLRSETKSDWKTNWQGRRVVKYFRMQIFPKQAAVRVEERKKGNVEGVVNDVVKRKRRWMHELGGLTLPAPR